jgi:hypothetical protein
VKEPRVAKSKDTKAKQVVGFFGVGLDNKDGEERLTRSEHFFLVGGSHETHERMQDTAIRFTEELNRRGKPLTETPLDEVVDIFRRANE